MDQRWDDDVNRKLLIHPPELSGNLTSSHLIAKHEDYGEEMLNFA
jgi:hypothetical protein